MFFSSFRAVRDERFIKSWMDPSIYHFNSLVKFAEHLWITFPLGFSPNFMPYNNIEQAQKRLLRHSLCTLFLHETTDDQRIRTNQSSIGWHPLLGSLNNSTFLVYRFYSFQMRGLKIPMISRNLQDLAKKYKWFKVGQIGFIFPPVSGWTKNMKKPTTELANVPKSSDDGDDMWENQTSVDLNDQWLSINRHPRLRCVKIFFEVTRNFHMAYGFTIHINIPVEKREKKGRPIRN